MAQFQEGRRDESCRRIREIERRDPGLPVLIPGDPDPFAELEQFQPQVSLVGLQERISACPLTLLTISTAGFVPGGQQSVEVSPSATRESLGQQFG